ncbi:pectin lyase fold/virulence factor, partial [Blyttiomyces helicus]
PPINTDGIDISRSKNIFIKDINVPNGDNCVALSCHGISIGSLGKGPISSLPAGVSNILFENITMANCAAGPNIKTWSTNVTGTVSNVTCRNIVVTDVANGLVVNPNYGCSTTPGCVPNQSLMALQNITFAKITGSVSTTGITFESSQPLPAQNISFSDILVTKFGSTCAASNTSGFVKGAVVSGGQGGFGHSGVSREKGGGRVTGQIDTTPTIEPCGVSVVRTATRRADGGFLMAPLRVKVERIGVVKLPASGGRSHARSSPTSHLQHAQLLP